MTEPPHLNPMLLGRGMKRKFQQEVAELLLLVLVARSAHQFRQDDRRKDDAAFFQSEFKPGEGFPSEKVDPNGGVNEEYVHGEYRG